MATVLDSLGMTQAFSEGSEQEKRRFGRFGGCVPFGFGLVLGLVWVWGWGLGLELGLVGSVIKVNIYIQLKISPVENCSS